MVCFQCDKENKESAYRKKVPSAMNSIEHQWKKGASASGLIINYLFYKYTPKKNVRLTFFKQVFFYINSVSQVLFLFFISTKQYLAPTVQCLSLTVRLTILE